MSYNKIDNLDFTKLKGTKLITYDNRSLKLELPWVKINSVLNVNNAIYLDFNFSKKFKAKLANLANELNYKKEIKIKLNSNLDSRDVFYFTEDRVQITTEVSPESLIGKKVKCLVHFIGFNNSKELVVKVEQLYFKHIEDTLEIQECSDLEDCF